MVSSLILSGIPYKRRGNELIYKACPLCDNRKWNFQVNVENGMWHCWACDEGGKLQGTIMLPDGQTIDAQETVQNQFVVLPEETVPIWLSEEGRVILTERGVTEAEAAKVGLQFDNGSIYVPYFEGDELVGYNVRLKSGRWMFAGRSRSEVFYIVYGSTDCVAITEGIFDGIKVARTGHTVLVLFGRMLYESQISKLQGMFDNAILAFDNDRPGKLASVKVAERLKDTGLTLYMAKPPTDKKDFGDCTTEEVIGAFESMRKITFSELLGMRMEVLRGENNQT